jgi:hypothetical protein
MGSWNDAKEAADLETYSQKEGGGFPVYPKPDWVDIPNEREWTELTPQQRWYYKNRSHRMEVKDRRRDELKRWFYEYKRDNCRCERCGEDCPHCIDFHHVGDKTANVSQMVNHGYSKERIKAEIARCDVLCANCHRKLHDDLPELSEDRTIPNGANGKNSTRKQRRRKKLRAWANDYKESNGGCALCDEDDPLCLEFHHVDEDEKTRSISTLIAYNPSKKRLLEEIEKCAILCRNCHRKVHHGPPT